MNKLIFSIIGILLLTTFISASPVEDILSEDATHLEITLTQNETLVQFYLNTSGYEWDVQDIEYEDFKVSNIPISTILNEINFKVEYNDGEQYPNVTYFNIKEDSLTYFLVGNVLTYLEKDYDVDDLNSNLTLAQEFLQPYLDELEMQGNAYIEKDKTDYTFWSDYGYEDTTNFKEEIKQVIEGVFYSINIKSAIPFEVPYLNLDYNASVNLSDLKFENGNYEIILEVSKGQESWDKVVYLNLEDIEFEDEDYIPEDPVVKEVVEKVRGLKAGTIVTSAIVKPKHETTLPTAYKQLKFIEINTSQNTSGWIYFKLNKSNVENPEKVSLFVWEGLWNELPTTFLNETFSHYNYRAFTPHFSLFLIVEDTSTSSSDESSGDDDSGNGGGGSYSDDDDDDEEEDEIPDLIFPHVCDEGASKCAGDVLWFCEDNQWRKDICYYGCSEGKCGEEPIEITPPPKYLSDSNRQLSIILSLVMGIIIVGIGIHIIRKKRKSQKNSVN